MEQLHQQEKWLSARELADVLNVHPVTIHRMAAKKRIPSLKIGKVRRFNLEDVEEALESRINALSDDTDIEMEQP